LYVELFDIWFVFDLDLEKSLNLCFEWFGMNFEFINTIWNQKHTKERCPIIVNYTTSFFRQIVVSDTPWGTVTVVSAARPLTWYRRAPLLDRRTLEVSWCQGSGVGHRAPLFQHWVPPYFSSLRPLGKIKIYASLTVISNWNFDKLILDT